MYQNLKETFWWQAMKKDVAQFVSAYLTCKKAKVESIRDPMGFYNLWKY